MGREEISFRSAKKQKLIGCGEYDESRIHSTLYEMDITHA